MSKLRPIDLSLPKFALKTQCVNGLTRLEMLGGKWVLLVLQALDSGEKRFGVLYQSVPGISENVLVQKLSKLQQRELIARKKPVNQARKQPIGCGLWVGKPWPCRSP